MSDTLEICVDEINGDDSNPGTKERPVKTSEAALALIPERCTGSVRIIGLDEWMEDRAAALLLEDLRRVDAESRFTQLFQRGCDLLGLDDAGAAAFFDTSVPNVRRWRSGKVVPPAAGLVLRFLREGVEQR